MMGFTDGSGGGVGRGEGAWAARGAVIVSKRVPSKVDLMITIVVVLG